MPTLGRPKGSYSVHTTARANALLDRLRIGPATAVDLMNALNVDYKLFRVTLILARRFAEQQDLAIPRPVVDDGFLYRLTDKLMSPNNNEIYEGVMLRMVDEATRASSTLRDLRIAELSMTGTRSGGQRREVWQWVRKLDGRVAELEDLAELMEKKGAKRKALLAPLPVAVLANGKS